MPTSDDAVRRGVLVGTWIKLPALESVEIAVDAGFDFAIVDLEHAFVPEGVLSAMLAVAAPSPMDLLVRVPDHSGTRAKAVLDGGAAGVVVPNVETREQAVAVTESVRFPPLGRRGLSVSGRAGSWGMTGLRAYMEMQNASLRLYLQIESRRGIANAREIAAVPGVDGLLVGPADLSADVRGTDWEGREAELLRELERHCAADGVALGTATDAAPERARDLVRRGYRLLAASSDVGILRSAGEALQRSLAEASAHRA
ncbi:HpcH/HpaI aldolase family protein [Amycolatopsis pithecellobii]|nr:aldolase/citrate lyase family protein [Amycolatopsis pithecellobii]